MTGMGIICVVIITMGVIGAIVVALLGNALREQEREKQAREQMKEQIKKQVTVVIKPSRATEFGIIAQQRQEVLKQQGREEALQIYGQVIRQIQTAAANGENEYWLFTENWGITNDYCISGLKELLLNDGFVIYKNEYGLHIKWGYPMQ